MSDDPDFSTNEMLRDALERALNNAGRRANAKAPRWSHVKRVFGYGKGYSIDLCVEFDIDPHEGCGGLDETNCHECGRCQGCDAHRYEEHDEDCGEP